MNHLISIGQVMGSTILKMVFFLDISFINCKMFICQAIGWKKVLALWEVELEKPKYELNKIFFKFIRKLEIKTREENRVKK